MISSDFIRNILELLLDGDEEGLLAFKQIEFLTEDELDVEYTGVGAFYGFKLQPGIEEFRLPQGSSSFLQGVEIRSPEIEQTADAVLHFTEGLISSLEIWCHVGPYPKALLSKYTLTQTWPGSQRRMVERK